MHYQSFINMYIYNYLWIYYSCGEKQRWINQKHTLSALS